MTNRAVGALVGAAITTVIATTATIGQWAAQEPLDIVAGVVWVVLVVIGSADRITSSIDQAAARIERATDFQRAEAVIDSMQAPAGLRGVR